MESIEKILKDYAKKHNYDSFFLFKEREGLTEEEIKDLMKQAVKAKLEEAEKEINEEYSKHENSGYILPDYLRGLNKPLKIINSLKEK